jgi:hypothetical protein
VQRCCYSWHSTYEMFVFRNKLAASELFSSSFCGQLRGRVSFAGWLTFLGRLF